MKKTTKYIFKKHWTDFAKYPTKFRVLGHSIDVNLLKKQGFA